MNKFIKGNCVALSLSSIDFEKRRTSSHILCDKDLARGYYYTSTGKVLLEDCSHMSNPLHEYFLWEGVAVYSQTLKGKITQPINGSKFLIMTYRGEEDAVCYINFKGHKTKVQGFLSEDRKQLYFHCNSGFYKTKVYVDEFGTLRGITEHSHLSAKQRRQCTNLLGEEQ